MVKIFKALVFNYRLKREIRTADDIKNRTGKKQFVVNLCGKPLCVSKEHIRRLIAQGLYRKGVTVGDIARMALYKTQ